MFTYIYDIVICFDLQFEKETELLLNKFNILLHKNILKIIC